LASTVRILDSAIVLRKYQDLKGQGSKRYRDVVIEKAFQLIAGRGGDLSFVLQRWFNRVAYFKEYRKKRDDKIRGLFFFSFSFLLH
jgi:hypothetical protein